MDKETFFILHKIYDQDISSIADFIDFTGDSDYSNNEIYLYLVAHNYVSGDLLPNNDYSLFVTIEGAAVVDKVMKKRRRWIISISVPLVIFLLRALIGYFSKSP